MGVHSAIFRYHFVTIVAAAGGCFGSDSGNEEAGVCPQQFCELEHKEEGMCLYICGQNPAHCVTPVLLCAHLVSSNVR